MYMGGFFFNEQLPKKEITSPDNNRDPVRCLLAASKYSQPGRGPRPPPPDLEVLLFLLLLFPPDLHELLHLQHVALRVDEREHHLTVLPPQEHKGFSHLLHYCLFIVVVVHFIFSLIP